MATHDTQDADDVGTDDEVIETRGSRAHIRSKLPKMVERARTGSRAAAIRLFCLECMGGSSAEVRRCTDRACPLFIYRSGTIDRDEAAESADV